MNFKKEIISSLVIPVIGIFFVMFFSPLKALALFLGLTCVVCAFLRPQWLILFLVFLIPLEPFALKFVPNDLYIYARYASEVMVYMLFLSACVRSRHYFAQIKKSPIVYAIVFLFFTICVSIVLNISTPLEVSVLGARQIIRFVLLFFVAFVFLREHFWIKKFFVLMAVVVVLESSIGIAQALSGGALDALLVPAGPKFFNEYQLTTGTNQFWEEGQRIFATMGRYDQLGTFLVFFLLFLLAYAYEGKNPSIKKYGYIVFLLALPALLLTYSRASWFGFFLGMFLISVVLKKDRRVRAGCIVALVIGAAYLLYSGMIVPQLTDAPRQTFAERFFEAFSFERWRGEYYGYGRLFFMVHAPVAILSHAPLFGLGPGTFGAGAATALQYTEQYDRLHLPFGIWGSEGFIDNNWLSIFGEIGSVGLLAYWMIFFLLMKESYRVWKQGKNGMERALGLGYMAAVCAVWFQAFLATYLEMRTLAVYFWLCGGIVARLAVEEREKKRGGDGAVSFCTGLNGQAGTVFCEAKRDGRLPDKNLAGIFVESAKRYSAGFM
ncbi:O-antigen ligase family protein [Candidatus Uhrbacteria bacterium]|nr:O-antigen ligase family protein [Candidatus Uhrbacteria bacterium]